MENGLCERILEVLRYQRDNRIDGSVYKACQCDFAYNSNHIEGSTLTHDQTVQIFDRGTFAGTASVDDIVEARNHFTAFDHVLETVSQPITPDYLKRLHRILKAGTSDETDPLMRVGEFKRLSNVIASGVGSVATASPSQVPGLIDRLVEDYETVGGAGLERIVAFHHGLEVIHPFSDGNGRVGRLVMFKECLRWDATPFIVTEDLRPFYIRGLREFGSEPGYLLDTCGAAQDRFEENYIPLVNEFWDALHGEELTPSVCASSAPPRRGKS